MNQKLFSTLALAGLSLVLAACGNSANSTISQSQSSSTTTASTTEQTANSAQMKSDDEAAVLDILARINQASVNKDVDMLNDILPDNYVLIHMTGYRQSKEEWLDEVASGSMEYFNGDGNTTSHQEITINGDIATVSSKGTVDAKIGSNGTRRTWNISSTATFKKINGIWVIQETDATK